MKIASFFCPLAAGEIASLGSILHSCPKIMLTPSPAQSVLPELSAGHENERTARTLVLIAGFLGWMFDGMEMGIFPLVARPALQQMQSLAAPFDENFVQHWMGIITALFLLGAA